MKLACHLRFKYLTYFLLLLTVFGCKKDTQDNADKRNVLKDRFQGKYSLISAISNTSIDLNFDGVVSIDMLTEIENLDNSFLELNFNDGFGGDAFVQFWQNQQFPYNGVPDNEYVPLFANQAHVAHFTFDDELKNIVLSVYPDYDIKNFPLPTKVTVLPADIISAITTRKVYTTAGWKEITIEARYKRYYKPQ